MSTTVPLISFRVLGHLSVLALSSAQTVAAEEASHLDGKVLGVFWASPFVGMLLSIAILPLVVPHFWHRHYGKIAGFWGLIFVAPLQGVSFFWTTQHLLVPTAVAAAILLASCS